MERVRYPDPVPTLLPLAHRPTPEQYPPAARAPEVLILRSGNDDETAAIPR
jgi:hypothetical protein